MSSMTRRGFVCTAGVAAAAPVLGGFAPAEAGQAAASTAAVKVENDVVLGKGGELDLQLDIYHPAGTPRRMAVIHLHGGGFAGGSKAGVATPARAFARYGYVSIGAQYRLTGQARWPAQIEDVKAAIRWTRANAGRLNIDADKIAVAGYSAGAFMALVAAGTSDRPELEGRGGSAGVSSKVSACAAFYPAVNASPGLMPEGADPAAREAAAPARYISASFAPTIFLHGIEDTTIPPEVSLDFFQRLRKAGVKTDLHLFQGAPHAFTTNSEDASMACAHLSDLFFDRLIVNPREYPPFGAGRR